MDQHLQLYCRVVVPNDSDTAEAANKIQPVARRDKVQAQRHLWINGTTLTYYLFHEGRNAGTDRQLQLTRRAFDIWNAVGLGVTFRQVTSLSSTDGGGALIRVGFRHNDGSWALQGRRAMMQTTTSPKQRTCNIGGDHPHQTLTTALQAVGHALGLGHEHQSPACPIRWNTTALLNYLAGPPNYWDAATVEQNILQRRPPTDELQASRWDADSLLQYPFHRGLIESPHEYQTKPLLPTGSVEGRLSELDEERALLLYPPLNQLKARRLGLDDDTKNPSSLELKLDDGAQGRFNFRLKERTVIELFVTGDCDTYLVLFERPSDETEPLKFLMDDDDTGLDRTATIVWQCHAHVDYVAMVRFVWMDRSLIAEAPRIGLQECRDWENKRRPEPSADNDPYAGHSGHRQTTGEHGRKSYRNNNNNNNKGAGPRSSSSSGDESNPSGRGHHRESTKGFVTYQGTDRKDNNNGDIGDTTANRESTKGFVAYQGTDREDDDDNYMPKRKEDPPKSGCCVIL